MEWTKEDRIAAVKALSSEWPYLDARELYEADGDSIENIAVFLQMQLLRAASPPEAAGRGDGWKLIPNDDTDLGDCFVGRWYPGKPPKFMAFQRQSPCLGWIETQDFFTHYRAVAPPSGEQSQPSELARREMYEALVALRSFMWSEGYADQTGAMAKADAAIAKAEEDARLPEGCALVDYSVPWQAAYQRLAGHNVIPASLMEEHARTDAVNEGEKNNAHH